jgi:hypothetical protein
MPSKRLHRPSCYFRPYRRNNVRLLPEYVEGLCRLIERNRFRDAQPCGITDREDSAALAPRNTTQEVPYLLRAEDDGQLLGLLRHRQDAARSTNTNAVAANSSTVTERDREKRPKTVSSWPMDRAWKAEIVRTADQSYPDAVG